MRHVPADPTVRNGCRVLIIGGGTVGWMCAISLQIQLRGGWSVQVASSDAIPPIGVGESSTGLFTAFLAQNGIPEADLITRARATLKLGTWHRGWRRGRSYLGPIDNPDAMAGSHSTGSTHYQRAALAEGLPVSHAHLNGWLMRAGTTPLTVDQGQVERILSHAWHFDTNALGLYLADVARSRGVSHVNGEVVRTERDSKGAIRSVFLRDGTRIDADFFVDCTGGRRLLARDEGRLDWSSYAGDLLADRAVVAFAPHDRAPLPVYTGAVAASAGWIWEIPTLDRMGYGYVHSSQFISEDAARAELDRHVGKPLQRGPCLNFSPGRVTETWRHNSVAIGMAAGFPEPLEATSLHLSIIQISLLAQALAALDPGQRAGAGVAGAYNRTVAAIQDDFRDFIGFHYLGLARDNPFWRAARDAAQGNALSQLARSWRDRFPEDEELRGRSRAVSGNLILPVADGVGVLSRTTAGASVSDALRTNGRAMRRLHARFASGALPHRAALDRLIGQRGHPAAAHAL